MLDYDLIKKAEALHLAILGKNIHSSVLTIAEALMKERHEGSAPLKELLQRVELSSKDDGLWVSFSTAVGHHGSFNLSNKYGSIAVQVAKTFERDRRTLLDIPPSDKGLAHHGS